jgi:hypothetical protein
MAIRITTNKPIARHMRTDTSKATTAVAAGAGTNSTDKFEEAMRQTAWLFLLMNPSFESSQ